MPQVQQIMPQGQQITPQVQQVMPQGQQITPQVQQIMPQVQQIMPQTQQIVPQIQQISIDHPPNWPCRCCADFCLLTCPGKSQHRSPSKLPESPG